MAQSDPQAPTVAEIALAAAWGIGPDILARARATLNAIDALPWPEPERISLVARLARAVKADVGLQYAAAALRAAPITSYQAIVDLPGIGPKRAAALARALAAIDPSTLDVDLVELLGRLAALEKERERLANELSELSGKHSALVAQMQALELVATSAAAENEALKSENAQLRAELRDAWNVQWPDGTSGSSTTGSSAGVMALEDIVSSVGGQVAIADGRLGSAGSGIRLHSFEIDLTAPAGLVDGAVGLALAPGREEAASSFRMSFAAPGLSSRSGSGAAEVIVPNVCGYASALARRKIEAAGLVVNLVDLAFSTTAKVGTIAQQSPAGGEAVPRGSVVKLLIARE